MLRRGVFNRRAGRIALAAMLGVVMVAALLSASDSASADERDGLPYTVEYYFDGEQDIGMTETLYAEAPDFTVFEGDIPDKCAPGYQPAPGTPYEPGLPAVITAKDNVIKVFYVGIPDFGQYVPFTIEYYYDGTLDETKTEIVNSAAPDFTVYEEMIPDKAGPGYQLDPETPYEPELPVWVILEGETIKVFYITIPDYVWYAPYTVEYYYDGEPDMSKTESLYAEAPDFIVYEGDIPDKSGPMYQPDFGKPFEPGLPTVITSENNVISVYYLKIPDYGPMIPFTVEYYYDGVLDESATIIRNAVPPDYIVDESCFPNKAGSGYILDPDMPFEPELPAHPWDGDGVVKVFYVTRLFDFSQYASYVVEYYYDGELDKTKTEVLNAEAPDFYVYEEMIPDKADPGYMLDPEEPYEPELPAPAYGEGKLVKVRYVSDPGQNRPPKGQAKKTKTAQTTAAPASSGEALPVVSVRLLESAPDSPPSAIEPAQEQADLTLIPPIDRPPAQVETQPGPLSGSGWDVPAERGPGKGMLILVLVVIGIAVLVERLTSRRERSSS